MLPAMRRDRHFCSTDRRTLRGDRLADLKGAWALSWGKRSCAGWVRPSIDGRAAASGGAPAADYGCLQHFRQSWLPSVRSAG